VLSGCPPLSVSFNNLSPVYPNSTLEWNFDDGNFSSQNNPNNNYLAAGSYQPTLTITTQDTCSTTDTLSSSIEIAALPLGSFIASPPLVYDSYPIINFINNESTIKCHYDFGDGLSDTICNTLHSYSDTGQYVVTLITENINGCSDTSKQIVNVKSLYTLFIPNAFTPNDDGINDFILFSNNGMVDFSIKIYNRFGQIVFTSNTLYGKWNGNYFDSNTKCPDGVYVYTGESTDVNKKKHNFSGSITLMR
jgi:gliding motility-associated-like protein